MRDVKTPALLFATAFLLSACSMFQSKGPIDQERSQLKSESNTKLAEGRKMIEEGQALQNRAKESRVVAASNRREADVLMAQGKTEEATQLRLQADQHDADADATENRGRDLEQQGVAIVGEGQDLQNRRQTLEKQGDELNTN